LKGLLEGQIIKLFLSCIVKMSHNVIMAPEKALCEHFHNPQTRWGWSPHVCSRLLQSKPPRLTGFPRAHPASLAFNPRIMYPLIILT